MYVIQEKELRTEDLHALMEALVDTMSFQSPTFYHRPGYEVLRVLDDFPGEHRRI